MNETEEMPKELTLRSLCVYVLNNLVEAFLSKKKNI